MFNNTVIAGSAYLAFGTLVSSAPLWAWGVLGAVAVGLDVAQILLKTTKIVLPVVGVADLGGQGGNGAANLGQLAMQGNKPMPSGGVPCACGKPGCPSLATPKGASSACAGGQTALYESTDYL